MDAEVFLEQDYDSPEEARQARNTRAQQLSEQGLTCVCENLTTLVTGYKVYLVQIIEETANKSDGLNNKPAPRRKSSSARGTGR